MCALWPLVVPIQGWALKSHWLQRRTLSVMLLKYPLLAQGCSLDLFESVTCMWVKTEPGLLNNIFLFFQMSSVDSLSAVTVDSSPPQPTVHPQQASSPLHAVASTSVSSLSTDRKQPHNCDVWEKMCQSIRKEKKFPVYVSERLCTKQRMCLLDFIYELDSLGKGRKQRSGGDVAEACEDDEWVATRSPFGASAHQNKPCEQCLLGKRVCGLWSCDERHLSPSDQMPHTTLLCLLLFILY